MPTYEYICPTCQKTENYHHKMNETISPLCIPCFLSGNEYPMKKGFGGGSAVHFKGNGFYETDYKGK